MILASASPRRKAILESLGIRFEVVFPEVDEVLFETDAARTVTENSLRKGEWCRKRNPQRHIIAADTALEFRGRCITKPSSLRNASEILRTLSGRAHSVLTGVYFSVPGRGVDVKVTVSSVTFNSLDDSLIRRYLSLVNPLDKAGAYDINQHGDLIIRSVSGSRTNVMGLPVETVTEWITTIDSDRVVPMSAS